MKVIFIEDNHIVFFFLQKMFKNMQEKMEDKI